MESAPEIDSKQDISTWERLRHQARLVADIEKKTLVHHGLKPEMRVLDLGCGPGFITPTLAEIVTKGKIVGLDLNEALVEIAKKNAKESNLKNVLFQKGNLYNLEKFKESFDFVYARFIFQYLAHPGQALEQIFAALKPGGRVLLADIDDDWVFLYPENNLFSDIFCRHQVRQEAKGGDRFVGRKLYTYLKENLFEEMKTEILTFTSNIIGMDTFLDWTTGYKAFFETEKSSAFSAERMEAIRKSLKDEKYLGSMGVFTVSGQKPTHS